MLLVSPPTGHDVAPTSEVPTAFNPILKVGKSKSLSLSLLGDGLMAVEAASSDSSSSDNDCCGCAGSVFGSSKRTPAFTSIPYYHVLAVHVDCMALRLVYATPTESLSDYRNKKKPPSQFPVQVATTEFTINQQESASHVEQWVKELRSRAYGNAPPNRRIYAILNPYGGKGNAESLWEKEIRPLLEAAGCTVRVQHTQHSGHAIEIARDLNVDEWDVIACCSGDGVVCEVFNGLSQQSNPLSVLTKVSVVQLPCGSGNAMSFNLTGTVSPSAATIALIKGVSVPLDLMSVTQDGKRTLSFLSQSLGMIADCDVGTDDLRWMGPARFTVGVLWRIMRQTIYPCDLAFSPATVDDKDHIRTQYLASLGSGTGHCSNTKDHDFELRTQASKTQLFKSGFDASSADSPLLQNAEPLPGMTTILHSPPITFQAKVTDSDTGVETNVTCPPKSDECIETAASPAFVDALSPVSEHGSGLPLLRYGTVDDPLPSDWTVIQRHELGTFYAGNMGYMADDAHFFPTSKPSDGMIDVVITSGRVGRRSGLEAVLCIDNGPQFFGLPMVEYFKTDAFRVIPRPRPGRSEEKGHKDAISIDGEPSPYTPFQVEIHRGMARVITLFGTESYAPGSPWTTS